MRTNDQAATRRQFLAFFSSIGLASSLLPGVLWEKLQAQESAGQGRATGRLTTEMLRDALAVSGMEFSEEERQQMLNGANQSLARYEEIRNFKIDPAIAPPMYFSPLVPGTRLDRVLKPFRTSQVPSLRRPANLEDMAFWPILNQAHLLKTKQVKSVELTEMYLARLRKHNAALNCVVTFTDALAMKQARQADQEIASGNYRGPLHGIPWGCKDIIAVPGYPTTWGSNAFKDQTFDYEATVVRLLREAGAVLIAKLTTGELAFGDWWFGGRTNNPWDLNEGASGSSTGPACASAAGVVGFAIGTETSGSILYPSTRCGATGLRPTFGRVSRHGSMTLSWSRDRLGPICRTVEDCAVVMKTIARPDEHDVSVIDLPFNWDAGLDIRKLRVGYLEPTGAEEGRSEEWTRNDHQTLDQLRSLGLKPEPFTMPKLPMNLAGSGSGAEGGAYFDEALRTGRYKLLTNKNRVNGWRSSRLIPAVEFLQGMRVRAMVMRQLAEAVSRFDVFLASSNNPPLAAPGAPGGGGGGGGDTNRPPSRTRDEFEPLNVCGYPALSVPNGFTQNNKPTSITFLGRLYAETEVLALAKAYQDATHWHERHPSLTGTSTA